MKKEKATLHKIINDILKFHIGEYVEGTPNELWEMEILLEHNNKVKKYGQKERKRS